MEMCQANGFDQGCNMSPAIFCVAVTPAMRAAREAMRKVDPLAEIVAYMDDTYFIGKPQAVERGRAVYQQTLADQLKIQENMDKRKVLCGADVPVANVPQDLSPNIVTCLTIVGTQVTFACTTCRFCNTSHRHAAKHTSKTETFGYT